LEEGVWDEGFNFFPIEDVILYGKRGLGLQEIIPSNSNPLPPREKNKTNSLKL